MNTEIIGSYIYTMIMMGFFIGKMDKKYDLRGLMGKRNWIIIWTIVGIIPLILSFYGIV